MKRIIIFSYIAILIVMGAATLIENNHSTAYVHQHIYGAWWFTVLWAVLAISSVIYIIRYRERRVRVLLLHASFLVILAGALLSHLTGRSGQIHLRMGQKQSIVEIEHNGQKYLHQFKYDVELTDFQILKDKDGRPMDFCSKFTITPSLSLNAQESKSHNQERIGKGGGEKETASSSAIVSMNKIAKHGTLRFYQMSYDSDLRGSTLLINRDPWGIPVTYCGYGLLFISFIWLCLSKPQRLRNAKSRGRLLLIPLFAVLLTAAWCLYYFVFDGSWSQIPVLRHPLLIFHVVIIMLGYALLLIEAIRSAVALARNSDVISTQLLKTALCLLSIGIFLGAIWANISWGNYWSWDSKEVWALITLMIYAVPLHRRSLAAFNRPKTFHLYMLLAFATVLMTYFGVNYLLGGLHSYN